jgi:hypothetical protein
MAPVENEITFIIPFHLSQEKGTKKGVSRKSGLPLLKNYAYFTNVLRMYLTTSQISLSFKVLP